MTESADSRESETTQIDPALADQVGVSERRHTLNDGHQLPQIGMGTYPMDDADAEVGVYEGINRGFRLIDTAVNYGNEIGVGRGIALAGLPRDEVFVTTKIPGRDQGDEATVRASVEGSLERLGLDRLDLLLIHWPNPQQDKYVQTFRTMLALREEGLVRSVGVSNFTKSSNPKRMAENLDVFGWELSDQQMERIRLLHTGLSGSGFDPDEHEEM